MDNIVKELLDRKVLTDRHLADVYPIAYSIWGRVDYLVTWDTRDLAREWTRNRVTEYGVESGRKALVIDTPIEVAKCLGARIAR